MNHFQKNKLFSQNQNRYFDHNIAECVLAVKRYIQMGTGNRYLVY